MSLTYQLPDYLVAVLFRSGTTLLVEGRTDRIVMGCALNRLSSQNLVAAPVFLDDHSIISPPPAPGMGAREIVEHVHQQAKSTGKLVALVDREFREFDLSGPIADKLGAHAVVDDTMVWTRGHSIENYFLTWEYVEAVLHKQFGEKLEVGSSQHVALAFPALMISVAALSIAGVVHGQINRMTNLVTKDHWELTPLELRWSLVADALHGRGVSRADADAFAATCGTVSTRLRAALPEISRWVSHGHLGHDALWTGVAAVLAANGLSSQDADGVATGHREEKIRTPAFLWTERSVVGADVTPNELWLLLGVAVPTATTAA